MKAAFALLVAVSIAAGEAAAQRFRSGVDVVTVDALVTEGGRAVTGLKAEDFRLRDNGVLQEIDSVTVDEAPISMLLALDTSNSVEGPTLGHLKQAAVTAVDALAPSDRAAVTFAESVKLRADWSAPTAATRTAIASAESGGATSLYDASYAALTLQDNMPGRRSYILLFSDGGDTSSWLPASALLERARRSDAVVYVVTRRTPRPDVRLEYRSGIELWTPVSSRSPAEGPAMLELAAITGGHVFVVQRADELRAAFAAVVSQFRSRYLLTYRPRGVESAGWHSIGLELTRGRAIVTARRGYAK